MNEFANLTVIGTSYKFSQIELLEKLQLNRKELNDALNLFTKICSINGIVIVSTCNRVEFYISHSNEIDFKESFKKFYNEFRNLDTTLFEDKIYVKTNSECVSHLFRVISGLDSLVLGEYQIQGQVKEAYSIACQAKTADKMIHKLFHSAFRCGKRIRSTTSIGKGRQSIAGISSEIIVEQLEPSSCVTIVGINENSKIIAQDLIKQGCKNIFVVNRTLHKAMAFAEEFGATAFPLDRLEEVLPKSDIIFTSTSAPNPIISANLIAESFRLTRKPRLIIDIAIPRDVETAGLPKEINYLDIENIKQFLDNRLKNRAEDLPLCENIIDEETKLFLAWQESQNDDIFAPVAEKLEAVRLQLLEEYQTTVPPTFFEKIDKITRQFLHRMKPVFISLLQSNRENS